MGFFSKSIMEENKEPSLENRIIDLINLNSSVVKISYGKFFTMIPWWGGGFEASWIIEILTPKNLFCLNYTRNYNKSNLYFFEDSDKGSLVKLDISFTDKMLTCAEERIKNDFIKKIFPIDPAISKVMSDVQDIQDSKEQVDYILAKIQGIKNKY